MKEPIFCLLKSAGFPLFLTLLTMQGIFAQIPPGYYDPANGLTGVQLQAALHNIIKDHTVKTYDFIWTAFYTTDDKPDGTVWDMYSDIPGGTPPYIYHFGQDQCGNYNGEGDCYNREHSWPKSWFNDASPMASDIFHIYPTDGYVNGRRSNYAYSTVSSPEWTSENGSKLGNSSWPGFSGTAFEPVDTYKGDLARTYFYMSTRYYTEDAGWNVTDMTNRSQLKPWAQQMMLHWHSVDPVSTKETDRNNAVYGFQNNRNPFIDHPEYANMIWGNPVGTDQNTATTMNLFVYPNPATDQCRIVLPENMNSVEITFTVFSVDGMKAESGFSRDAKVLEVNLSTLKAGIYFITLSGVAGYPVFHGKLVKN